MRNNCIQVRGTAKSSLWRLSFAKKLSFFCQVEREELEKELKKATNKKKEVAGKDGDDELDNYLATLKVGALTKLNKDAPKQSKRFS